MSYAKVTLVGNVGRDPEFKAVGESEVCNFTLATTRKVKGDKITQWWAVSSWNERLNKIIGDFVKKGSKLLLIGEPDARAYLDKADQPTAQLSINISFGEMVLLDSAPREEGAGPPSRAATGRRPAMAGVRSKPLPDDDVPFDPEFR